MTDDTPDGVGASALSRPGLPAGAPPPVRRERLAALFREARGCERCPQLVAGRTQVVFGAGNANADVLFVAEAPGAKEDQAGAPLVGATAKLLDELLESIGLRRADVFVSTVLKCHPPGNRDPSPAEIARCTPYLHEQVALVEPRVVCTLGAFPTRLLRGDGAPLGAIHGRPELVTVGRRVVYLLPLFHPAAALYTRPLLDALREDVARLPQLLDRPAPVQPTAEVADDDVGPEAPQGGLF
ncbi:MAG: uracil-DNA glycosylase [Patulibacter sp.]|nr:uracil-DNA glycosylase [Patulibacter sp.]